MKPAIISQNELALNGFSVQVKMALSLYEKIFFTPTFLPLGKLLERNIQAGKLCDADAKIIESRIIELPGESLKFDDITEESVNRVMPFSEIQSCVKWYGDNMEKIDDWIGRIGNKYKWCTELCGDPLDQRISVIKNIYTVFGLYRNFGARGVPHDVIAHPLELLPLTNKKISKLEIQHALTSLYGIDYNTIPWVKLEKILSNPYRKEFWNHLESIQDSNIDQAKAIQSLNNQTLKFISSLTSGGPHRVMKLLIGQIPIASSIYEAATQVLDYQRYKEHGAIMYLADLSSIA